MTNFYMKRRTGLKWVKHPWEQATHVKNAMITIRNKILLPWLQVGITYIWDQRKTLHVHCKYAHTPF